MALKEVKEYLKKYNAENRIVVLGESSATVTMAAHALHTTEERIAKTLSFKINDNVILIVLAGDLKLTILNSNISFMKKHICFLLMK